MDLEGRDAVYTYPDNTHNKNYYANFGGNHFVNDNSQFKGICILGIWKEEIIMVMNSRS